MSSASISDAMARRFSHRWHILDLVSPTPGAVLHGWAATVRFLPRRDDLRNADVHDFMPATLAAAGEDPSGRVLVVTTGSYRHAAVAGGKKLTLVDALGFSGLLTDGRLRDFDEARQLSGVFYCGGEAVLADRSDLMAFEANAAVELAAALITPGDWIYADAAGAVIVPGDHVQGVLEAAAERERADAAESERIRRTYRRTP
ncbi:MAG: RraA family protein [Thermoleophilia bacterium]|nr:RraA family protein [Thermoleophilia bacterium]MDH3724479.1 RraA family protein [Thermoleophilia bacterium]